MLEKRTIFRRTKFDRHTDKVYRIQLVLDEVINEVAKGLEIDPVLLKILVTHQFHFIKNWLQYPTTAMLQIMKFGYWVVKRRNFYNVITKEILWEIRKNPTQENIEYLRYFLKYRLKVNQYYARRAYKVAKKNRLVFTKVKIGKVITNN